LKKIATIYLVLQVDQCLAHLGHENCELFQIDPL